MAGIVSYGAYIPVHRLERSEIGRAWGGAAMPGEKAVANYDEDSITMAVAACLDCMADMDRQQIDGVFFATTTSPFKEKQAATIIARAIDLRDDAQTVDYTSSVRAGTSALKAALDAVSSGSAKQLLVVAADCRPHAAQGPREFGFGDGAAALLVSNIGEIGTVIGSQTIFSDLLDVWRTQEDQFVRSWEERFIIDKGYMEIMLGAISAVMKDCSLTPKDIATGVLYSPDLRSLGALAKRAGLDPKSQIKSMLHAAVGNTGTAFTLMMLVEALEQAGSGDKLLVAGYGDGSDAFVIETTGKKVEGNLGIKGHLAKKRTLKNYEAYARIKNLIPMEPAARPPKLLPSVVSQWRKSKQNLALYGTKCNKCGKPQYPMQRICAYCQSWDDFTPYRFSDKKAKLFSFTFDNLGFSAADVPPVGGSVVNFDEGGRILCQMCDCDFEESYIDMPLQMTFRKLYQAEGVPFYTWKSKPAYV